MLAPEGHVEVQSETREGLATCYVLKVQKVYGNDNNNCNQIHKASDLSGGYGPPGTWTQFVSDEAGRVIDNFSSITRVADEKILNLQIDQVESQGDVTNSKIMVTFELFDKLKPTIFSGLLADSSNEDPEEKEVYFYNNVQTGQVLTKDHFDIVSFSLPTTFPGPEEFSSSSESSDLNLEYYFTFKKIIDDNYPTCSTIGTGSNRHKDYCDSYGADSRPLEPDLNAANSRCSSLTCNRQADVSLCCNPTDPSCSFIDGQKITDSLICEHNPSMELDCRWFPEIEGGTCLDKGSEGNEGGGVLGSVCTVPEDCISLNCEESKCATGKLKENEKCIHNDQCESGICDENHVCGVGFLEDNWPYIIIGILLVVGSIIYYKRDKIWPSKFGGKSSTGSDKGKNDYKPSRFSTP